VDFSGAQLRNAVCVATQDHRREDTPGVLMTHLRGKGTPVSNGQTPDPFAGITTLALMKEVFRRLG
jgi:hypothetical protein